jgi:hypothetical protein
MNFRILAICLLFHRVNLQVQQVYLGNSTDTYAVNDYLVSGGTEGLLESCGS